MTLEPGGGATLGSKKEPDGLMGIGCVALQGGVPPRSPKVEGGKKVQDSPGVGCAVWRALGRGGQIHVSGKKNSCGAALQGVKQNNHKKVECRASRWACGAR